MTSINTVWPAMHEVRVLEDGCVKVSDDVKSLAVQRRLSWNRVPAQLWPVVAVVTTVDWAKAGATGASIAASTARTVNTANIKIRWTIRRWFIDCGLTSTYA